MEEIIHNETGIHFQLDEQTRIERDEILSGMGDYLTSHRIETEFTDYYTTGFSFMYRGARISGKLNHLYIAEYSDRGGADFNADALQRIVEGVCGFRPDWSEVEE